MKLSIIVPVYNVEKYIARCLDGLLHQDLTEYEIIIINDGTPDNSMEYIEKQNKLHDNIIIIDQENGGLSAARNTGIRHARGEYLFFCDSDDTIVPNCLNKLYEEAKKYKLDMLLFDADTIYEEQKIGAERYGYYRTGITEDIVSGAQMLEECLKKKCYYASSCMYLINRDFVIQKRLEFFEGIIHEDELFTPVALAQAERVVHRNWPIYQRYVREGSIMTGTSEKKHLCGIAVVISELSAFYNKNDLEEKKKRLLKQIVKNHIRDFRGRMSWMDGAIDNGLLEKKEMVTEIVKRDRLWLGIIFYIYLYSIRFRK